MSRLGYDRDTILLKAIAAARAFHRVMIAWRTPDGNWRYEPYPLTLGTLDNYDAIRYILPNGEVTKLP